MGRQTGSVSVSGARVDPETPIEESLAAVQELRDRRQIRRIGISEVSID
jgi:aryl-alcohol dehydrogenase-like predicted oxidoreductase